MLPAARPNRTSGSCPPGRTGDTGIPIANASAGRCKRTRLGAYLGRHLVRKGNLDEVGGRALLLALLDAHDAGGLPGGTKHPTPIHSRQMGRAASSASHARTHARTHRQRSHAVGAGLWKAWGSNEPGTKPHLLGGFHRAVGVFLDIFSCIRRCARLDAQKMSATLEQGSSIDVYNNDVGKRFMK